MSSAITTAGAWAELLAQRAGDPKPWLIVSPRGTPHESERRVISYGQLAQRALSVAHALRARVGEGARVQIVMDNSPESALLVLAALAAGVVAVPIAPPWFGQPSKHWLAKSLETYRDCAASLLVGPERLLADSAFPSEVARAPFAQFLAAPAGSEPLVACRARDQLALLQYTSGTTASARGVRLGHAQLDSNLRGIGAALAVRPDDVGLCWLPLSHDMGLLGSLLFSTYWGISLVLLKPQTFLMHPESWLWAIARERVSLCAAPNSAYWLCASKLPERKLVGLDLSSWRVAINGAESIHAETVATFTQRFSRHGFRAQALRPAYGLAECGTAVCLTPDTRAPRVDRVDCALLETRGLASAARADTRRTREVVSVGTALADHQVRIVADAHGDRELGEREIGAIQVRGPSVTDGYYGAKADETGVCLREGWLSTGDRGYLADGELYVLGREKATIKRAGRSIDCAYIEDAIRALAGVRGGRVAALGVAAPQQGGEQLLIVAETGRLEAAQRAALLSELRAAVREALGFTPELVALVAPGTIPRTTSGKVRHGALRAAYLAGEFAPHREQATTAPAQRAER